MSENEIKLEDLPVRLTAYEDENGYALVLDADDARIGGTNGVLVKNFLVRIARGDVPKVKSTHPVTIARDQVVSVEVGSAKLDETGRMFVENAADGVMRPAAEV